jgi:MFS family permease
MTSDNQATRPSLIHSWCVILTASLFFFYAFIQMNLFNAISNDLVKEFGFTATQLGNLGAFFFFGNVLFLFPAGMLLDRYSVRKILLMAFTTVTIFTYVFSATSDFHIMCLARLLIGIAGSFTMLSAIKLATRWFEPRHMALVIGMTVTMAMLGGAVSQTPLSELTQSFGWRGAMQIVSIIGVLFIIIQFIVVHDEPKNREKEETIEHTQLTKIGFWHTLGMTMANAQNWLCGLYICFVNLPLFVFGATGVAYLTQVHNLAKIDATNATTMLFIGMMIGSPLSGIISDKLGKRKLPMLAGAILTLLALLIIMFAPTMPPLVIAGEFLFIGLVMGAQVLGYPVIAESNLHSITATASSLGSTVVMAGGMLMPIFGQLLDLDGIKEIHTYADFTRANSLMLGGVIIAMIAALLIKETNCKQLQK